MKQLSFLLDWSQMHGFLLKVVYLSWRYCFNPQRRAIYVVYSFLGKVSACEFYAKAIIAAGSVQKAERWVLTKATVNYTVLVIVGFKWLLCYSNIKNIIFKACYQKPPQRRAPIRLLFRSLAVVWYHYRLLLNTEFLTFYKSQGRTCRHLKELTLITIKKM